MGRKCIVPNCTTGYESNTDKVSLFKIPSDQLEVWKKSIPRKDRELTCKDHVCAKHFNTEDILREIKTDLVTIKLLKPKLSKEAVPTKFPGCPKYLSSDIKKRRIIRKCENWPIIKKRKVQTTIVQDTHEITKITALFQDNFYQLLNGTVTIKMPSKAWNIHYVSNQVIDLVSITEMIIVKENVVRKKSYY